MVRLNILQTYTLNLWRDQSRQKEPGGESKSEGFSAQPFDYLK
jgi:hypothetical protein